MYASRIPHEGSRVFALALIILVAFTSSLPVLAQNGVLDHTFGTEGMVTNLLPGGASDVAVQSDGTIIIAGWAAEPGAQDLVTDILLAGVRPDGTLDAGFGTDGSTLTHVMRGDEATRLVILPDDRILVAGLTGLTGMPDPLERPLAMLARYTPGGVLDPSFGDSGSIILDVEALFGPGAMHRVTDLAVDPAGLIYVAGSVHGNPNLEDALSVALLLARFLPDGTPDSSFGQDGVVLIDVPNDANAVLYVRPAQDGIVAAGGFASEGQNRLALLRFDLEGNPDPDFGTGDAQPVPFDGVSLRPVGLVDLPDGKILVAGTVETLADRGVGVARFLEDGSLDASFAGDGVALVPIMNRSLAGGTVTDLYVNEVLFMADEPGTVLIGGSVEMSGLDFFLTRIDGNGEPDPNFGAGGIVTTDLDGFDMLTGLAVQPDGRVVAVGAQNLQVVNVEMARYLVKTRTDTERQEELPAGFVLSEAYPNPFNPSTRFTLTLDAVQPVRIDVLDVLGRQVYTVYEGTLPAGEHAFSIEAGGWTSGTYFIRATGRGVEHRPITLLR